MKIFHFGFCKSYDHALTSLIFIKGYYHAFSEFERLNVLSEPFECLSQKRAVITDCQMSYDIVQTYFTSTLSDDNDK